MYARSQRGLIFKSYIYAVLTLAFTGSSALVGETPVPAPNAQVGQTNPANNPNAPGAQNQARLAETQAAHGNQRQYDSDLFRQREVQNQIDRQRQKAAKSLQDAQQIFVQLNEKLKKHLEEWPQAKEKSVQKELEKVAEEDRGPYRIMLDSLGANLSSAKADSKESSGAPELPHPHTLEQATAAREALEMYASYLQYAKDIVGKAKGIVSADPKTQHSAQIESVIQQVMRSAAGETSESTPNPHGLSRAVRLFMVSKVSGTPKPASVEAAQPTGHPGKSAASADAERTTASTETEQASAIKESSDE